VSSGSAERSKTVAELVERVRVGAERAAAALQDPAIRASMAAEYEGRVVDLPEVRRRGRERDWRARGIPERLWAMFHDGAPDEPVGPLAPKPTAALEAVGKFLSSADARTVLVLAGPVDTGKTVAAAWGAAWSGGRLVKAIDLIRAGMYPDDHGFWPRVHAEKLLVVDDLGTEPLDGKGYGIAAITDLVDRRYDGARKTIVTTNLPLEEFKARYGAGLGARLWRRIVEVGRFVELPPRSA
jgi:hypothetical protein